MLEGLEIIQELGQQRQRKFGKVFLCQQLELSQKVILKSTKELSNTYTKCSIHIFFKNF